MEVLLVDIGNSRIKWRVQDLAPDRSGTRDAAAWDVARHGAEDALRIDDAPRLASRWRSLADRPVRHALVCNVADESVARAVEASALQAWPSLNWQRVTATTSGYGVVNAYSEPARLGADRWMALVGARAALPAQSLLVCAFGTATTIDLLRDDGARDRACFIGGLILPGFATMRDALLDGTARLPDAPGRVVDFATATEDAITSGIAAAQIGAVARALRLARVRFPDTALAVVLAGGAVGQLESLRAELDAVSHVIPDVVLRGLAVAARRHTVAYDAPT